MTPPFVPQRFRTDSAKDLAQDLERQAQALIAWAKEKPSENDILPLTEEIGAVRLAFGRTTRVKPIDGEWISLELRAPGLKNASRSIRVIRLSTLGAVELVCIDCTVNGYSRLLLLGDIRINTLTTDGENYFMDNSGALNWGTGL